MIDKLDTSYFLAMPCSFMLSWVCLLWFPFVEAGLYFLNPCTSLGDQQKPFYLPLSFLTLLWQKVYLTLNLVNATSLSPVQSLSRVRLFATPWIAARQASLSITNSQNLPKLMSIESVMPSSHLILCCPLLLLCPIPPSIRVFSNESTLHTRWPKYWSFSFSNRPT